MRACDIPDELVQEALEAQWPGTDCIYSENHESAEAGMRAALSVGMPSVGSVRGDGTPETITYQGHHFDRRETVDALTGLLADARRVVDAVKAVEQECWSIKCESYPTGGDDADVGWEVISHWQAKPHDRVEGRGKTPMAAITDAMAAKSSTQDDDDPPEEDAGECTCGEDTCVCEQPQD